MRTFKGGMSDMTTSNFVRWEPRGKLWIRDRKSTRLNSSHLVISYAVFCLKKKKNKKGNVIALQGGESHPVTAARHSGILFDLPLQNRIVYDRIYKQQVGTISYITRSHDPS